MDISEMAEKAQELYHNTPTGEVVVDADTILADQMESLDWQITGCGEVILQLCNKYTSPGERAAMAEMFAALTDMTLEDYLEKCVKETTRDQEYTDEHEPER